jgi:hypothetical protein
MRIVRLEGVNRLCGSITRQTAKQKSEKQNDLDQSHPFSVSNAIRIHRARRPLRA